MSMQLPTKPANFPVSSLKGAPRSEDPAVLAVMAPQAILEFERLTPVEVIQVVPDAALVIVGMDSLRPTITHFLR